MSVKKQKSKSKKLSLLRKKILSLWSKKVRERDLNCCIYCGIKTGEINKNNKKIINNAHHCLSKDIKNSLLKYDIRNGVTLCPEHHKWSGTDSAHKAPIIFYEWLRNNREEQYYFVLKNATSKVNLDNEYVLLEILNCLENDIVLEEKKLSQIENKTILNMA